MFDRLRLRKFRPTAQGKFRRQSLKRLSQASPEEAVRLAYRAAAAAAFGYGVRYS